MTLIADFVEALGDGVYRHRHRLPAPALRRRVPDGRHGRAAFIDTGTNHARAAAAGGAARAAAWSADDVDCVIPTHVHLDHAGGAGLLMRRCRARGWWCTRAASATWSTRARSTHGATAVYGAGRDGPLVRRAGAGVDAERIAARHDGMTLELGGRTLRADRHARPRAAPPLHLGRAHPRLVHRRHLRPRRTANSTCRAAAPGSCRPRRRCSSIPSALRASVAAAAVRATRPCMYLTHYGRVADVPRLGRAAAAAVDEMVAIGRRLRDAPGRHGRLRAALGALYGAARRARRASEAGAARRSCWRWTSNSTRRAWPSGWTGEMEPPSSLRSLPPGGAAR